jgi:anti-sigma regulatory factor (Ser/Thr protein kinase)
VNPRTRIFAGVLVLFAAGVGYLLYKIIRDLEPRYRESVEEPLVDTAAILAALIAADSPVGVIDIAPFRRAFAGLYERRLDAQIYRLKKTEVDLRVYVTDRRGIVLFDSSGKDEGEDYSRWNDVRLTLAGRYAEVVNAMRPVAERRGVALELEGGEDLAVQGDRFLLQRALTNLVQNAIDFSSASTAVTVRVEVIEKTCQITVIDQGSGIPDYALDRIFERFYSLPRSGPEHAKGTGLGLSFVREIADLHRGTIDLQNRPEGGAIATLTLPLAPAPPNSP